jgi:hypothetical protein
MSCPAVRTVVSYRRTDNWWNQYVGHHAAYAATNFPFGVVTLYPAFFRYAVDDTERDDAASRVVSRGGR